MTKFTYTREIPLATNSPSVDQPNMKVNTNSIDDLISEDHISFETDNGGYHNVIHQDNTAGRIRSGAGATYTAWPAAIANINQLFAADYTPDTTGPTTDTQLFSVSGADVKLQLSGGLFGSDGYAWVGGILVQWGQKTGLLNVTHQSNVVTFKDRVAGAIPFPNNCWNVFATLNPSNTSTTAARAVISVTSVTTTGFAYVLNMADNGASNRYPSFYWVAIGN